MQNAVIKFAVYSYHVGHFAVEALQAVRAPLPHLLAGLVEHAAITHDILILLYQVTGEEHSLNVEVLHIVGYPCRTQFEERLIDVVLGVALRVAEDDE